MVVAELFGQLRQQRAALGTVGAWRGSAGHRDGSLLGGALLGGDDDEDSNDGADSDDERGDQHATRRAVDGLTIHHARL